MTNDMISVGEAARAAEDVTKAFIAAIKANVDEETARKIGVDATKLILDAIFAPNTAPDDAVQATPDHLL